MYLWDYLTPLYYGCLPNCSQSPQALISAQILAAGLVETFISVYGFALIVVVVVVITDLFTEVSLGQDLLTCRKVCSEICEQRMEPHPSDCHHAGDIIFIM